MDDIDTPNSIVLKNYNYIYSRLSQWIGNGYDANQILMAMDKLYVVCVPVSEDDNAQKIFESINATGSKLTAADLIRNFLLMDLRSELQDKYYSTYWKRLEEHVSQDSKELEMFFRMFIAIKTYTLVPKNSVYREFMYWVKSCGLDLKPLSEELLEYSKIYEYLFKLPLNDRNKKLQIGLTDFRKIKSDLPMPAIMEFCRLYRNELISEEVLGELILSINSYLIRRSICDMNSQNISKLFPSVLKKVLGKYDGDYSNVLKILNQEMVGNNAATSGSYMPTDEQMHEQLHSAAVYKRPALRIILDRMELQNNPAPVDLSVLSVEHLMPQTASEEWLKELHTDSDTYQINLNRLGNLTLTTKPDNIKMGNATWNYKNEVLKDTGHLTLNMELIKIDHWDLQHIEDRTNKLIDRICEIYPYLDVKVVTLEEDVLDTKDALDMAIGKIGVPLKTIQKGSVYKSQDNENGYVLHASKMYPQGEKEKYWFAYRIKKWNQLDGCNNLNLVFICRHKKVHVVILPKTFLDEVTERLNITTDDNGNILHYHIVIFVNQYGKISMLLSNPELEEVDISKYECK